MAQGLANIKGVTKKEIEELQQMLNDLNKLIGSAANTGGTTTVGTVMAKLNKLLTDWTNTRAGKIDTIHTNVSNLNTRLTSTRGGYLDKLANFGATGDTGGTSTGGTLTAKVNTALSNIGQTGNTGGSTSAGTMMAKLNKLLGDWTTTRAGYINTINTNTACLTSTRAGYIDKLSNFGATGDTGGSATAGTLMGKINKLLSDNASGGLKIKSIQSGNAGYTTQEATSEVQRYRYIRINEVNLEKSILISDTGSDVGEYGVVTHAPHFESSTHLVQTGGRYTITGQGNYEFFDFNWSVIEFY